MAGIAAKHLTSTVRLNDGVVMPLFGFGTFRTCDPDIVSCALKNGYRLIDSAQLYGNEREVGLGVKKSCIPKEEIFVVSKVDYNRHGFKECSLSVEESLQKMDIGYIDLVLIHTPSGGKILETYDALLKFKEKGLIRSVGVSNFGVHHLEGLKQNGRPQPSVNQIELHVSMHQQEIVDYCIQNGIGVMGYSPLAKMTQTGNTLIEDMAKRYNKSVAQVMIRWSVQKGYVTIPKTSSPTRLVENADVFDFSLSDDDMLALYLERTVLQTCKMEKVEVRAVIKYLCKKGMTTNELHEEEFPSCSTVKKWAVVFELWSESIEDDERSGRPKDATTDENVEFVHNLVMCDRSTASEVDIKFWDSANNPKGYFTYVRGLGKMGADDVSLN